jgi:NAD(P)-dependent dehydrogenase (short-subunit alcohol dehydrogenase family)
MIRGQRGEASVFEDLAGRVAVVTGGARGLGLSMARALARHGVNVGLVDLLDDVEASATALADELGVESVGTTAPLCWSTPPASPSGRTAWTSPRSRGAA